MAEKFSGALIAKFVKDGWPWGESGRFYLDDSLVEMFNSDGDMVLLPAKEYSLSDLGIIVDGDSNTIHEFSDFFMKWDDRRRFDVVTVSFKVGKGLGEGTKEFIVKTIIDTGLPIIGDIK